MGKKKDKKGSGAGAAKTAAKTARSELKALKKEMGEDDIDTLLADLRVADAAATTVTITVCDPPTPRSNASWVAHPNKAQLLLFGGELYNGQITSVYNELFIYDIAKKEWRKGGEFTSPSGNQFHHYRDLWKLDLNTYMWELKSGGEKPGKKSSSSSSSSSSGAPTGPSARSGHRMLLYKQKLLVFGGFFDNGSDTRYFNDLHAFDLESQSWLAPIQSSSALSPTPRSGFGFFVNEQADTAFVLGGFAMETKAKKISAEAAKAAAAKKGNSKKSSAAANQTTQVPVAYADLWALNLNNFSWTLLKRRGYFPAAGRFAMGVGLQREKQRVFVFGGVRDSAQDAPALAGAAGSSGAAASSSSSAAGGKGKKKKRGGDDEEDEDEDEDAVATTFNDLYCFDMRKEIQRFFFVDYKGDPSRKSHSYEVSIKVKAKTKKDEGTKEEGAAEKGEDETEDGGGEDGGSIFDFNPVTEAVASSSASSSAAAASSSSSASAASSSSSSTAAAPVPLPRRSALLCCKGSHLYLYGGVQEQGSSDVEHTFGDVWSLDVSKGGAQGWELLVAPKQEAAWAGSDAEDEDDDAEEEDEEEEKAGGKKGKKKKAADDDDDEEDESSTDEDSDDDSSSAAAASSSSSSAPSALLAPLVGESLTVYFSRTKGHWMAAAGPAIEEDKRLAAAAAAQAQRQAAQDAEEEEKRRVAQAREEEAAAAAAAAASAPSDAEAAPAGDAAAPASASAAATPNAASLPIEKASKASKADKKSSSSAAAPATKGGKGAAAAVAASASSASATSAAAASEKELRTKAFELASARFQQR